MTDEYDNAGKARFDVELLRGNESQHITVCADLPEDAERIALEVAADETNIDWETEDGKVEVGEVTFLEADGNYREDVRDRELGIIPENPELPESPED